MEIVEKVAEDKQEQHANANGQLTAPNDLPYTKERLAMMSIIVQRIMTQTGEFLALARITEVVKTVKFGYNEKLWLEDLGKYCLLNGSGTSCSSAKFSYFTLV